MSEYSVDGVKFTFAQLRAEKMIDGTERFSLLKNSDCYKDNLTGKIIKPCIVKAGAHLASVTRMLRQREYDTRPTASGSTWGSLEM
jgi:hypothetical protein